MIIGSRNLLRFVTKRMQTCFALAIPAMVFLSCSVSKEQAFVAVADGKLSSIERFVSSDPDNKNAADDYGNSLLAVSIRTKQQTITDYLLAHGADANVPDKNGFTPLHIAATVDNVEAAKALFGAGIDLNQRNGKDRGKTALHYAAINGSLGVAEFLIASSVDIDIRCSVKATPLSWAAYTGSLETVKFFISKGADTTARDSYGDSILGAAKNGKKNDIYDYLISIGVK